MRRLCLILMTSLVVAGCSRSGPAVDAGARPADAQPGSSPPAPAPAPNPPAPPTTPPATAPPTVQSLNDQAFALIKDKRWEDAIAAAGKAVEADPDSSAAWFNLGRARLGAGQAQQGLQALDKASTLTEGRNADVEYFRGKAATQAGQVFRAALIYTEALRHHPGDREISEALKVLQEKSELRPSTLAVDLDGDSKPERVTLNLLRVTILSGTGSLLFDADVWERETSRFTMSVEMRVLPVEGALPLLLLQRSGGCPAYYENELLFFDTASKRVRPAELSAPCALVDSDGKGKLSISYRSAPYMESYSLRWSNGSFVRQDGRAKSLMARELVTDRNLSGVLHDLIQGQLLVADDLFASPAVKEQFAQMIAQSTPEALEVGQFLDASAEPLRVPVLENNVVKGYITFSLKTQQITAVQWQG